MNIHMSERVITYRLKELSPRGASVIAGRGEVMPGRNGKVSERALLFCFPIAPFSKIAVSLDSSPAEPPLHYTIVVKMIVPNKAFFE